MPTDKNDKTDPVSNSRPLSVGINPFANKQRPAMINVWSRLNFWGTSLGCAGRNQASGLGIRDSGCESRRRTS